MAKLTINPPETPSETIIKAANVTVKVIDARGRSIEIRKLKTLDRMRLFELVGAENSMNDRYLGHATLAYSVVSIDGTPLGRPATKLALEGIVQQLDDDGFEAVAKGSVEHFLPKEESLDQVKADIKNG